MAVQLVPTEMTQHLKPHELNVIRQLLDALSHEDGFLIPGKFEPREDALHGSEVDSVLVLPELVILLEMKSFDAQRIDIVRADQAMTMYRDGVPDPYAKNPLAKLSYASKNIKDRLRNAGCPVQYVYPLLVADAYGRPFDLRVGPTARPYGVVSDLAGGACQAQQVGAVIGEFRQALHLSAPTYPLHTTQLTTLERTRDAILSFRKEGRTKRETFVGEFKLLVPPVRNEAEFVLYRGVERDTDMPVWVKQYQRDVLATGDLTRENKLLLRDAIALGRLQGHPAIPTYRTKVDPGGEQVYIVLYREKGQFLDTLLEGVPLPLTRSLAILQHLLDGLSHIHGLREGARIALYRDLRPASVFVTEKGQAQLFNFDCTRLPTPLTVGDRAKRRAEQWHNYAADELLNGAPEQVGTPADVYSWCVIAYQLLSGKLPYDNAQKRRSGQFTPLASVQPSVPAPLIAAIEQGLNPSARRRPDLATLRAQIEEAVRVVNSNT